MSTEVEIWKRVFGSWEPVHWVASKRIDCGWRSPHKELGTGMAGDPSAHPLAQVRVGLDNRQTRTRTQEKRLRTVVRGREGCAIFCFSSTQARAGRLPQSRA